MSAGVFGVSTLFGIVAAVTTSLFDGSIAAPGGAEAPVALRDATLNAAAVGGANVVIYRRRAQPAIFATTVKIDGRKVASLNNGEYTTTRLAPGPHRVTLGWSFLSGQKGGAIDVEIGRGAAVSYLEVLGTSEFAGMGYGYLQYRMGSGLAEIDAATGSKAVALCCKPKAGR